MKRNLGGFFFVSPKGVGPVRKHQSVPKGANPTRARPEQSGRAILRLAQNTLNMHWGQKFASRQNRDLQQDAGPNDRVMLLFYQ